jgi:hypothetical protein
MSEGEAPGKAPQPDQLHSERTPLERVLSRLPDARRGGKGWMAKCPHHEDSSASLSIAEGADGKVLVHCFAGCPSLDVVADLGLSAVDLFPAGSRERRHPRTWRGIIPMAGHGRPALVSFGDPVTACMLAELARQAHVRGRLDTQVAGALRLVAAAVDVSTEHLREAVRDALATEAPA